MPLLKHVDKRAHSEGEFYAQCTRCGTEYFEPVEECDWCMDVKLENTPHPRSQEE